MTAILSTTATQGKKQRAFILLPVVLTLVILAAIAYLLSREGAINAGNVNREHKQDTALYVAQAGYHHAIWQLNQQNCTGYTDIPTTSLGEHNYLTSYTDITGTSLTAGSPANIKVVSTLATGVSYTINRNREKIYQFPAQQLILQPNAADGKDAYLWYPGTTNNYGSVRETWVSTMSNDKTVALYQFDLGAVPSDAKILSATLSLLHWQGWDSNVPINAHRITNSWNETEVSWDNRTSTQAWDTPAGDFDPEVIDTTLVGPTSNIRYEWQLKSVVEKWVSGSHPNYGVLLRTTAPSIDGERFYTSDDNNSTRHPRLTISYTCECGKTCTPAVTTPPAKKIYWTDDIANKIQRSDEDGSNVEDVISGLTRPTGLDIDTVNGKLYWTNGLQIQRANLDSSNTESVYSGSTNTFDIKLDVVAGKMYWTHDNGVSLVMRANLDGSNSETIDTSVSRPSYITLDTTAGHIYLTSYGDGSISRMDFDGSNRIQLVSGSSGPVGNAIDLINRKVYWSGGASNDWIKRADLDGNNVETIVTGLNAPQDIVYDTDNDRIYWVDALNILVQRSNPDGSNMETIVSTGLTRPRGIILVNSDDVLPECNGTFRDEFNTINFSGNDGSLTWTADWQEVGESDGAGSGDIRVTDDQSEYQLRLRDNDNGGEGVAREADLTGANVARLSLNYRRSALDSTSDYVSVEISATGTAGPWVERARFVGSTNDSNYLSWSYTLEAGEISANTAIRLRTSPTMGGNDIIYFDNIELQCSP